MDSLIKWVEAIPIRQHTAPIVARKLVDVVFSRFGTPLYLLSDRGCEFESVLMHGLYRAFGIRKIRTSSYKPSTNGALERFHKTLNDMLAKLVGESQKDLDQYLPGVMAAYRATVRRSTGFTPNFLLLGRENRAPVHLVVAVDDEPEGIGTSPNEY
jgi:transposase InsO family protein